MARSAFAVGIFMVCGRSPRSCAGDFERRADHIAGALLGLVPVGIAHHLESILFQTREDRIGQSSAGLKARDVVVLQVA